MLDVRTDARSASFRFAAISWRRQMPTGVTENDSEYSKADGPA